MIFKVIEYDRIMLVYFIIFLTKLVYC